MNKIFYTLFFLLFFSFFNNNAKAQTSPDVTPCTTNASGAVVITTQIARTTDQTCDTSGATNLTLNIHSLGFCTSAPTVNFVNGGKEVDERDSSDPSYSDGASNFSSCRWVITQSTPSPESLESVGAIEPLPSDEIPPPGTYTHAVIVLSNEMTLTGSVNFSQTIKDTTGTGINGNSGLTCWTNGTYFIDTGKEGPLIGTGVTNAATNKTAGIYKGGATCGDTASATANTIVSYYSNYEPAVSTGEDCASAVDGGRTAGCNTTRSQELTSFGNLTVLFTKASNLGTTNPTIQRSKIVTATVDGKAHGTATDTNTLTAIFAYNTPMTVTDKTTGMEIFINFNNALSLDFEPSGVVISAVKNTITNISPGVTYTPVTGDPTTDITSAPRIRAIQGGPFGIQFRSVEGGGTN
jgi:hypothetical protein